MHPRHTSQVSDRRRRSVSRLATPSQGSLNQQAIVLDGVNTSVKFGLIELINTDCGWPEQ